MTATAAPAAGATSAPTAPANGATSTATEPAPGTTTPAKPPEQATAKPSTTAQRYKGKYRDNGKEVEFDLSPDELAREIQNARHAQRERSKHIKEREAFESRLAKLSEDPDSLFQEVGFDVEGYLAQRAQRAEQMKRLTPEQQENLTLKEKLAKIEADNQKRAEQERVAAEQREHQEYVQQNVQRLGKAIELSGLPRSGELVKLYAEVQELAAHAGEPEMSPEQIVAAGERLMSRRLSSLLKAAGNEGWRTRNAETLSELAKAVLPALEGDALLGWIGKDNAMRVVKALHAKTRTSPVPIIQEPPPVAPSQTQQQNGTPMKTEWDILDALGA